MNVYVAALHQLRNPDFLDAEALTEQAYTLGIGFLFIRPTIEQPRTILHILPPSANIMIENDPALLAKVKQLWEALHERAAEIVPYLMDHESCSGVAPWIQLHNHPTPLRKNLLPRSARAYIESPANTLEA